jgi:excisionase family DNA binding protein
MYLSVQLAARRLGVSPYTIRRWTESGLLPCVRTAGGHRRIKGEDIDELARLTAGGDRLTARLAREREMETLVEASIALTSRLDLTNLLVEIARRLGAILDCHFCAVSDYDEATTMVHVLADFDRNGQRVADWKPYSLKQFPFTKRLMDEQELAVITVSDPRADPAETAVMRHYGDKTLLLIPLVHQGQSVGFLEVLDHVRERRFTRQELRLARALAGLATIALNNARVFAQLNRCNTDAQWAQAALDRATDGLPALAAAVSVEDVLHETAILACRTLVAVSAVATWGEVTESAGESASTPGDGRQVAATLPGRSAAATVDARSKRTADSRPTRAADGRSWRAADARLVTAAATSSKTLGLCATLTRAGGGDEARLLRLIATSAAQAIERLS